MQHMTLANIAAVVGGTLYQAEGHEEQEVTCAVIDSRKMEEGGLFFAAPGERVDGHRFINQVFSQGAACVVTQKTPEEVGQEQGEAQNWGPYILVEDSYAALRKMAAYYRSILSIPIVGITGSVGKTSTKEFIAGVLSRRYRVLKTEGNFNNEIGLPLTLLRIREEHEVAVVEMGISDFGEMSRLGAMARPDICVITNIGQCHLENLHDRAGIFKAKTEIFDYMQEDGQICLNGEDDLLAMVSVVNGSPVHHFGISEREDLEVYATDIENEGLFGSRAQMHFAGACADPRTGNAGVPVTIKLPGQHMVINAMAAAMVGRLLHMTAEQIAEGIACVEPVNGRSHLMKVKDMVVIDDCYNANPVSTKAAVDLLVTASGRKVAILGDMFELGERSGQMHAEVGAYAVEQGVDALFCVGEQSRYMYDAALERYDGAQDIRYFSDRDELLESLSGLVEPGDTVLIKASHGMEFHRIVERLQTI